jgi:phosphotransferase system  glucose/maltose/N-acetylglucosamine-specific IIC component
MPPVYGYGYPPPRPTVTSAVAIVALCLFWVPLVGLVLSIIGMVKTARGKARGRGVAIAALVLSILVTIGAGIAGAAIASKPSALDPGCTRGKTAVLEQSKQMDADSQKGDASAVQTDLNTLIGDLATAVADSHRSDVRSTVQAVHDDYAAIAAGHDDQTKLTSDLQQMDHLCTIGK